jgi:hypothetical protein
MQPVPITTYVFRSILEVALLSMWQTLVGGFLLVLLYTPPPRKLTTKNFITNIWFTTKTNHSSATCTKLTLKFIMELLCHIQRVSDCNFSYVMARTTYIQRDHNCVRFYAYCWFYFNGSSLKENSPLVYIVASFARFILIRIWSYSLVMSA